MTRLRLLLPLLLAAPAAAQTTFTKADLSLGVGEDGWRVAVARAPIPPMQVKFIEVGLLLRATAYGGDPVGFARRGGDEELPSEVTLDPSLFGVAAGVTIELPAGKRFRVGMNLDLLGVAFGAGRTVDSLEATPATFSYFAYGHADRGSLNSEFYLVAGVSDRMELRGGLSHYVLGYEIVSTAGSEGRYQRFNDALFLAVRLR